VRQIKWKLIKRLLHLGKNYGRNDFLEHVSPDFKQFIDVDQSKKTYMIRDLPSEEVIAEVPEYLMNYKNNPEEAILRFKWVGNTQFAILSKSGMEKLVDIGTNFRQEEFHQIQNFDYDKEYHRNFYFDREPLPILNVTERLIRKTQNYKRA